MFIPTTHRAQSFSIILSLLFVSFVADANYTEPTRRTVLNEIIAPGTTGSAIYPLYLSDAGRYYAEVYLTDANGETANSHQRPINLEVEIEILRKGKTLRSEINQVEFKPGEASKILFWARAPFDLPQRKGMEVNVAIRDPNGSIASGGVHGVRLQITRKFEIGPLLRH
ncbi:MAG: hypothetical protein ACU84Q_04395 [Gammaproteobacteria bacterium]